MNKLKDITQFVIVITSLYTMEGINCNLSINLDLQIHQDAAQKVASTGALYQSKMAKL